MASMRIPKPWPEFEGTPGFVTARGYLKNTGGYKLSHISISIEQRWIETFGVENFATTHDSYINPGASTWFNLSATISKDFSVGYIPLTVRTATLRTPEVISLKINVRALRPELKVSPKEVPPDWS